MRVKTPLYIQMENSECGAACLKILLAYYERYVPIEELRTACGVSRDGCTAYGMVKACAQYGVDCEGYSLTVDELKGQALPCILHWGFQHFVILEAIQGDTFYINDPAVGHVAYKESDFKRYFTGVILKLQPNAAFKKGGEKPGFTGSIKERLSPFLKPIFLLTGMQAGLVFLTLVITILSQVFIDQILMNKFPKWHYWFLGITAFVMAMSILLTYLEKILLVRAQIKIATFSSTQFFNHIFRLPLSFYEQRYASEIAYRSSLNQNVASFLTSHLFEASIQVLMIGVYGLALFCYSVPIGIAFLACGAMNLIAVIQVHQKRLSTYARYRQEVGKAASFSISALEGFETWKCLGMENRLFAFLASLYTKSLNGLHELQNSDQFLTNVSAFSQLASQLAVFGFGGVFLMNGTLTPGQFAALQMLGGLFMKPIVQLVVINRNFELFLIDLSRLDDVMQYPEDPLLKLQPLQEEQGGIELRDVSFRYNVNHPPILHDINFSLNKGECVALLGPSGSGKSTLVKMIAGFISPEKGEVKGNHRSPHDLSFVFDTPFFFDDSVRANVTLLDPTVPEEEMGRAMRDACIDEKFPKESFNEMIDEEGKNISGGERQRLEIARALLRNPSFIILDEATSALENETESNVLSNLKNRGCGILLLTHRLSAISLCDRAYVIDQGKIVQEGTPQELLQKEGLFKEMVAHE